MNIIDNLQWRYATKAFDGDKKIDEKTISQVEDGLVLTASSFGLQPWKFIVVKDQEIKKQLVPASYNQTQVENCSHLVVFAAIKSINEEYIQNYINTIIELRQINNIPSKEAKEEVMKRLADYQQMMIGFLLKSGINVQSWAEKQCYIALGNLLNIAAEFKIDSCPMEGIIPAKYDEILGLTNTNYTTCLACPLGYRSKDDRYASLKKVRFDKETVIFKK
jgi:nitroreductase